SEPWLSCSACARSWPPNWACPVWPCRSLRSSSRWASLQPRAPRAPRAPRPKPTPQRERVGARAPASHLGGRAVPRSGRADHSNSRRHLTSAPRLPRVELEMSFTLSYEPSMLTRGLNCHSTFERTSRESATPLVMFARMRFDKRLPIVTVGSVRPVREEYALPTRKSSIRGTASVTARSAPLSEPSASSATLPPTLADCA